MKKLFAVLVLIVSVSGCSNSNEGEKSLASKAGSQIGESLSDFASGIGEGVDQKAMVKVELLEKMSKRGLGKTVAKGLGLNPGGDKGVSVYVTSKTPFEGMLIAKALNKEGLEIGRSLAGVVLEEDDAKYVRFVFEGDLDSQLVDTYTIDIRKEGPIEKPIQEKSVTETTESEEAAPEKAPSGE